MSACCKGYVHGGDHDDACAYNPKNIIASPPETKSDAEKRMMDPERMKLFAKELASLKADFFARSTANEQTIPPLHHGEEQ